ncbi:MAG TPA: ATP-binding protein [Dissulfurispiraceae bacterium]|nr:ATP-binding protein [Dissulfurispiraceae bacterium]
MPKDVKMNSRDSADELERLRLENSVLAQQVKQLVRAEGQIYEYQEKLDQQLKDYKDIYELNKKLNATFDIEKTFSHVVEYVINNLEYERALIFRHEENEEFRVVAFDGYYDDELKSLVSAIRIKPDDPILLSVVNANGCMVCTQGTTDDQLVVFGSIVMMSEYLIYPITVSAKIFSILVAGNTSNNAEYYRRVKSDEMALIGMGNLAELMSSSIENHVYHANMQKALEQERLAEAKYRSIFENAAEGIFRTTVQGKCISCNPAAASILGYGSAQELMETVPNVERLYVDTARRKDFLKQVKEGIDVKSFEVEFFRKDGGKQWVMLSARPVFDDSGEVICMDGMLQDISHRKQAEESLCKLNEELEQRVAERTSQLKTANDELHLLTQSLESAYSELKAAQSTVLQQEKMASIGQLAAGVAHEINNPVGFIMSNLNSLAKYIDKVTAFMAVQADLLEKCSAGGSDVVTSVIADIQKQKKMLKIDFIMEDLGNIIRESFEGAERVKKIVQDLKTFSRVDESSFKSADINDGLERTINIIWNELKYKAILKRDYGNLPLTVCNAGQLNQVFMNVLINAAQAIETMGEIIVKTWCDSSQIYVRISDTGSGIPPEKIERIFEPFFTTKAVGQGTGLGLSIAYDIIKKHKGEITVDSILGKGTTFTFSIPIVNE